MPFQVVLFEPEIPPNTGNIMRLCSNTGCSLSLIEPLGFELDERRLRRAGLDYGDWSEVSLHSGWEAFKSTIDLTQIWAFTTRGATLLDSIRPLSGDILLFGPETRGLPQAVLAELPNERKIRVPMHGGSRSLNLANTVAVAIYEGWRQIGYVGGK